MKVLFISNDPSIFDETSAARVRMQSYAAQLGELHIVSVAKSNEKDKQEGSLFLYPVRPTTLFRVRVLARRARAIILEKHIEVVSAQDPFEHGLAALRATVGTGAKLHVQVHTDFLSPWFVKSGNWRMTLLNQYRVRIADRVLPKAKGVRVVSERLKASLLAKYGASIPVPSVIPIAIDSTVPDANPLPEHSFTFSLITVSRLEPEKRIQDILFALKQVVVTYPMVGLFIVGSGREDKRLEMMVRSLGLEKSVLFLGNRTDARSLMRSANAFIQASAYEGYGLTLIEAALAKVPIITTDVGIVGEVLKNEKDVLVAPVADPIMLAHAIERLIEENSLRKELTIHAESVARTCLIGVSELSIRVVADLKYVSRTR